MNPGLSARFTKWKGSLFAFAVGQPAVQLLNAVTGFLLLRWLDKEEYAMFSVAFAFQSTVNLLTDFGMGSSIVALAGERGTEPAWLGRYLRAARHYRVRILGFTLAGTALAFPLLTQRHQWGWTKNALLFGAVAMAVVFQGWIMYGSALLVHRRLAAYYRPQITAALVRLLACLSLFTFGCLTGWATAWLGALTLSFTAISYRWSAQKYVVEPRQSDREANRELLRYVAPILPGAIFFALQGQITLIIISVFGSTNNIADIAALGRLGQVFQLLSAFTVVIIEPYIARVAKEHLLSRYQIILGFALGISGMIALSGFWFPKLYLLLLGSKYVGLDQEVGWMVATACVGYITGLLWTMHAARKWVFWWTNVAYIIVVLSVQITWVAMFDIRKIMSVIGLGFTSAVAVLAVHVATGIYAFRRIHVKNPKLRLS